MVVSSGICCCLLGPHAVASPEIRGFPLEGAEAAPGPDAKLLTNEAHPLAKQLLRRRIARNSFHLRAACGGSPTRPLWFCYSAATKHGRRSTIAWASWLSMVNHGVLR